MSAVLIAIVFAMSSNAGTDALQRVLKQGQQVFNESCATGYCHAINGGAGGGGARLAARGFNQDYIRAVTSTGRSGTAMPGFREHLSPRDLEAVVAYVAVLNGIEAPVIEDLEEATGTEGVARLSAHAREGRRLFHDALRAFGRCSTCHQIAGSGVPAAEPIKRIPASAKELRSLPTPQVATVTVGDDSMPGLMVSRSESRILFYDLTVPPPVLRTVDPDSVDIVSGSSWQHSSVLNSYPDPELEMILEFLRETVEH